VRIKLTPFEFKENCVCGDRRSIAASGLLIAFAYAVALYRIISVTHAVNCPACDCGSTSLVATLVVPCGNCGAGFLSSTVFLISLISFHSLLQIH
jgi:hypothetical protein